MSTTTRFATLDLTDKFMAFGVQMTTQNPDNPEAQLVPLNVRTTLIFILGQHQAKAGESEFAKKCYRLLARLESCPETEKAFTIDGAELGTLEKVLKGRTTWTPRFEGKVAQIIADAMAIKE